MAENRNDAKENAARENAGDEGASTLLPMLVAGLVLIVVGAIVVMMFV